VQPTIHFVKAELDSLYAERRRPAAVCSSPHIQRLGFHDPVDHCDNHTIVGQILLRCWDKQVFSPEFKSWFRILAIWGGIVVLWRALYKFSNGNKNNNPKTTTNDQPPEFFQL